MTKRESHNYSLAANFAYSPAQIAAFIGRGAAGSPPNVSVNLLAPGDVWSDRLNELDFRIGKNLRMGRNRGQIALDLYNLTNANTGITFNQGFNPAVTTGSAAWLAPTSVMTARVAKISIQWDF